MLEDEIGASLFIRTKRSVELSHAGRVFLPEAREIIARTNRAALMAKRAGSGEFGTLEIGFVFTSDLEVLPNIIPPFKAAYPNVRLALHPMGYTDQVKALIDRRIHLGFLRLPVGEEGITTFEVARERLLAVVPASHPLAEQPVIDLRDLVQLPYIFFPRAASPTVHDAIVGFFSRYGLNMKRVEEADQLQVNLSLISMGIGFSLLPACVSHLGRRGVVFRPLVQSSPEIPMGVAFLGDEETAVRKVFLSFLSGMVAEDDGSGKDD